ncbi:MAG: hypothetical protein A2511_02670 [Deltaproteobacteria bacterium RIFOXYD12_FULL_50_9]|nr:MAG: hypothetical protein A2511_02670 [Deltaproteobacteria bacterium RIFOXYD12_FULL_50_9]
MTISIHDLLRSFFIWMFFARILLLFTPAANAIEAPPSPADLSSKKMQIVAEGQMVTQDSFSEIKGRLMIEGKAPMLEGVVAFFNVLTAPPPNYGHLRRIPDMVSIIEKDGNFSARLPAGNYYLGALNRKPDLGPGPPRPGESLYLAMNESGAIKVVDVLAGQNKDFGNIAIYISSSFKEFEDSFTVEGVVRSEDGKPVSDAMIMVKIDLNSPRPDLISANIGNDGHYRIKLPVGKTYHFIARKSIGPGRPNAGSYVGTYNGPVPNGGDDAGKGALPAPVSGKPGEIISGIDITVFEVPDPENIKKQKQGEGQKQQLEEKSLP